MKNPSESTNINPRSMKKFEELKVFMERLQITASAEEILTKDGFIKKIVYYIDNENYPVTEEKNDETTETGQ